MRDEFVHVHACLYVTCAFLEHSDGFYESIHVHMYVAMQNKNISTHMALGLRICYQICIYVVHTLMLVDIAVLCKTLQ